jgi:hypothetical protein
MPGRDSPDAVRFAIAFCASSDGVIMPPRIALAAALGSGAAKNTGNGEPCARVTRQPKQRRNPRT